MAVNLPKDELFELLGTLCNGSITAEEDCRLRSLLGSDGDARRLYVKYLDLHLALTDLDLIGHDDLDAVVPGLLAALDSYDSDDFSSSGTQFQGQQQPIPIPSFTSTALGYFSEGVPLAYLLATVIFGVGLLIGSRIYVSGPDQFVQQSVPHSSPLSPIHYSLSTTHSTVGRITGMVDCQWEKKGLGIRDWGLDEDAGGRGQGSGDVNPKSKIQNPKSLVALGDKFALSSGLMEITYDTGAEVILQGPCTYEVESKAGGYLSVGKLTARVEKKAESGKRKAEDSNPQSLIPNPPLPTTHYPLFTITTPTATVTDLGTEFGVDVDMQGNTTSRVYRGSVRLQVTSRNENAEMVARVLHENESARVEKSTGGQDADIESVLVMPAKSTDFVRELPRDNAKRTIRTFDLIDVVAGGDGFSGRRAGGIDPTTGQATNTPPAVREAQFMGDQKYHRVETLPFVDGVFIPNGHAENVQVDSAGHTFADFPKTDNTTGCFIWAGGPIPMDNPYPSLTVLDGVDYAQPGHGLLFLHASKGITFDLAAIRKANPDWKPVRFRAVAGNSEKYSEAGMPVYTDVWVLIDGQVRFRRREINGCSGGFVVDFPIGPSERFLTLVATDGGNGITNDWIIFGDPRLELAGTSLPANDKK